MKKYSLFLKIVESEKKGLDTQTFGINELYDLTEHTYNYFTSDVNGYKGEEKNKKIKKVFNNFPYGFIFNGIIILILILFYSIYVSRMHRIVIYFLEKLINFNNQNFEVFLKKLDELKRKFRNDDNEEDDKEDVDNNSE